MWADDSFAALLLPGVVHERADVPDDLYDETFALFNSLVSPRDDMGISHLADRSI